MEIDDEDIEEIDEVELSVSDGEGSSNAEEEGSELDGLADEIESSKAKLKKAQKRALATAAATKGTKHRRVAPRARA